MAGHTGRGGRIARKEAGVFDLVTVEAFQAKPDMDFVAEGERLFGRWERFERLGFANRSAGLGAKERERNEDGSNEDGAEAHTAGQAHFIAPLRLE
ncbi:MAG: hypothetical protein OXL36_09165 [Bryobacterales bacterium]|nr:hypothetical protein [Bryobacterales bacterium]MDE0295127.1 hypothetical protein [Bryobacterales bacterium]